MKKLILISAGVMSLAGVVHAGLKGGYPVSINLTYSYAMGGLASARSSVSANTHIGCSSRISTGPSYFGYCQARDDAGVNATCSSTDPDLVMQMARLPTDGRIQFYWDASGNCTSITVQQSSTQAPKL